MAEETLATAAPAATSTTTTVEEVVEVSDVPVAEKPTEPAPESAPVEEDKPAEEAATEPEVDEKKIAASTSFKEETNVAGDLPDPEKKALDELKQLVREALNKRELSTPPPPPPAKEEEKAPAAVESEAVEAPKTEEAKAEEVTPPPAEAAAEEKADEIPPPPAEAVAEEKVDETPPPPAEPVAEEVTPVVDDDGSKTVEAIEETIVAVSAPEEPAAVEETKEELVTEAAPVEPEEVSIWGITLLVDEKSDVVLLKFLRARDFKVKEAFTMLRNTVRWQKEFKIDSLLEEDLGTDLDKVVFISGVDKEGHPVCYNAYGEFQNKELYQSTFADAEKPDKFLRWRVQFLEKTIRKDLDFSPDGVSTFVQVNDLKASPGPFKRELKVATNQAVQLLQDNYPEFVAKQVFINVPWWYLAFYKMISPFFTQRTKSKFVFAGPSKSAETLFKYIAPEQVPVQYGGLRKDGEQEFTTADTATEEIIKPSTKTTIEFPTSEASTLVWEARVIGWDVSYGAEFVPSAEGGYTVIIQKSSKISPTDETVLSGSYKTGEAGKVVLAFDNSASSKKKKLVYRSKTKPFE